MILMMHHKNNLYGCDHMDHQELVEPFIVGIGPLVAEESTLVCCTIFIHVSQYNLNVNICTIHTYTTIST